MSSYYEHRQSESICTTKELRESLEGLPMRGDQWATEHLTPELYINGSSPADVFEAAATWARQNPNFVIQGLLWREDEMSLPPYGMRLLLLPMCDDHVYGQSEPDQDNTTSSDTPTACALHDSTTQAQDDN